MKAVQYLLVIILSVATAYATVAFTSKHDAAAPTAAKENAFAHIMRTHEIRCAYAPYPPMLMKDPNSGQMSGIFYDVMEEAGRRLSLKINWAEEVGYGVIAQGFQTDRYDAFCNTVWPTAERSSMATFTIPLFYSRVDVFVRADDNRFDNDLSKLDDPSITFAGRDGDISATFAQQNFPHAKIESIPELSDTAQLLVDVAHHKADATINEPGLLYEFLKNNPGSAKDITMERPLRVAPNTVMIKPGEFQFKAMLDTTFQEMLNSGFIDQVIRKYPNGPIMLRTALPYQPVKSPQ